MRPNAREVSFQELRQWNGAVAQTGHHDLLLCPDQLLDRVRVVPLVDVQAGQDVPGAQPERRESQPRDVAAEDHLVVVVMVGVASAGIAFASSVYRAQAFG